MKEPRVRDLIRALVAAAAIAVLAVPALATQPECTGDRHYDSEANGCCPNVPECKPVLPCVDPPPPPPVTCKNGDDGDTVVVEVDRCPQPEVLEFCKVRRNGEVVCPRSKKARRAGKPGPRKIGVPRSIIDQIADVKGY